MKFFYIDLDTLTFKQLAVPCVLAAIVAFLMNILYQSWRKRPLREKIAAFHRLEQIRRDKIKQRISDDKHAHFKWITSLPFSDLAAKLENGDLKAVDVLRAYQHAALKATGETNAVTEFVDDAEENALKLDQLPASQRGPLHGIPFSVKECVFLNGTEATCGHAQHLGKYLGVETAPLIKFLQGLGAIPFAKTNLPQALFSFDSRNPIYGVTKNPLDKTRTPGGSTSGEGALIAAGASPFGLGSDVGGSLRAPPAFCGLYSLKPSSSRYLQGGDFMVELTKRIIWHDFFSLGFITQDVDTLIKLHRHLYNQATFDTFPMNPMPPVPFREDLLASGDKLTIAYCEFDGFIEPVPSVQRALVEARQHLEKRGHRLVPWRQVLGTSEDDAVNFLKKGFLLYISTLMIDGIVETVEALDGDVEISHPNKIMYYLYKMPNWLKWVLRFPARFVMGKAACDMIGHMLTGKSPHDVNILHRQVVQYRRQFAEAFQAAKVDALLWPAMPFPAVPLDGPRELSPALSYLAFFNVLDWPAGCLPFGRVTVDDEIKLMANYPTRTDDSYDVYVRNIRHFSSTSPTVGLPLAVQIAAPQYREELVLRLMKELSQ